MILGLSETARFLYKNYIDFELLPYENHKFHNFAYLNTQNFGIFGGAPTLIFKVRAFSPNLTLSMILGLSETARLLQKYYILLDNKFLELLNILRNTEFRAKHIFLNIFFKEFGTNFECLELNVLMSKANDHLSLICS